MTQQERIKMTNNIAIMKEMLFEERALKDALLKWEKNKNVVISLLSFSSDIDLVITYIYYLNTMGVYLRHINGFDDMSKEQIINTRGTTDTVETIAKYFKKEEELRKLYAREVKKFDKEYNRLFNKRR